MNDTYYHIISGGVNLRREHADTVYVDTKSGILFYVPASCPVWLVVFMGVT